MRNLFTRQSFFRRIPHSLGVSLRAWFVVSSLFSASVLCAASAPAVARPPTHFTVTSDLHGGAREMASAIGAMIELAGGIGAFHVTCGDIVDPGEIRKVIDNSCGTNLPMFHVVGNHDTYWPQSTAWMREEFETGHGRRTPLSRLVARSGPPGCRETTYSWDFGNAHLVVLNEYWNGTTNSGSDTATNGSIEPELLEWLRADLAGTDKPLVFVFGHEPAFVPEGMRHRGDSLDAYPEQMENFCALLEREGVTAYINGHTHVSYQVQIKGVWHINVGTAGSRTHGQGPTFVSIDVGSRAATVSNWTVTGLTPRWTLKDRITLNSRRPVATTPPGTPP